MITAIVRFQLPKGMTLEDAKSVYAKSAPNYQGAPGLIRKYYLFGQDQVGGGVYFVAEPRSCREDVLPGVEEDDHGAVRRPTRDLLLRDASDRGQYAAIGRACKRERPRTPAKLCRNGSDRQA